MKLQTWVLVLCFVKWGFATTATAIANGTINGDFESPSVSRFATFNAPSSFLGWNVASGGVDIVADSFYASASGLQSLDLNALVSGSVFQNVATSPGQAYQLTFSFAANPKPDPRFPAPSIKAMEASWNNTVLGTFLHDTTGHTGSNVGWLDYTLSVVGTGSDRLTFTSLTAGSAGPAIDNVRLSAVFEPTLVPFDIKPGSDPSPINLKSKGVLPAAILGTDEFNVQDIDLTSLLFGDPLLLDNGGTAVSPSRSSYEDVSGDGLLDLTLKFSTADLVEYEALGPDTVEGLLTGALFDGTLIEGMDAIRIVPPNGSNGNGLLISTVPEPTTCKLVLVSLCLAMGRRRI